MENSITLLDQAQIRHELEPAQITLIYLNEVDSTNRYLHDKLIQSPTLLSGMPYCVLAESQTHGRGRMQRNWHSPFAQNIYLSLQFNFQDRIEELSGLSLIVGLSIINTLETLYTLPAPTQIKWPNDVLCMQKKLAGTLIETIPLSTASYTAIIGIGLNVNMTTDSGQITQPWTSIQQLTAQMQDRTSLCISLIQQLHRDLKIFQEHGLAAFHEQWKQKDALIHQPLTLHTGEATFKGKGMGINHKGQLLLHTLNKQILAFSSADASIMMS